VVAIDAANRRYRGKPALPPVGRVIVVLLRKI
jgi:hypothetical protein